MKTLCVIPARMASTRFPGKPMEKILGMPMIGHVYHRAKMCDVDVYVATCDKEIYDYIESIGGLAVMTSDNHEMCTQRVAEAVNTIDPHKAYTHIMIWQGDEPMISPTDVSRMIDFYTDGEIANLMAQVLEKDEWLDPNTIKVVTDLNSFALYFSREAIPSDKKTDSIIPMLKQVCVLLFNRTLWDRFSMLGRTPLDIIESIDMLRALENNIDVKMCLTSFPSHAVDTFGDMRLVELAMKHDNWIELYVNERCK